MSIPIQEILTGDLDFNHCNRCGYAFKRRGVAIDMKDFRLHKVWCATRPFSMETTEKEELNGNSTPSSEAVSLS